MSGHYVQLCPNPLRFEPVTKENSVFFDEANRQVWRWAHMHTYTFHKKTCGRHFRTASYIYHAYIFQLYLYQLFVWNSMKLLDAYMYIINVWDCMALDLWSKLPFQVFSVTSVEGKTRVVVRGPDVKSLVIFKYVADATNMVFIKHDSFSFSLWPSPLKGNQLLHSNSSHALTPNQKCFK